MSNTVNEDKSSPFHPGEQTLQTLAGKREEMESFGQRVIRPFMPEQHRDFFAQLPFMIVGSVDDQGWPWASIVSGEQGFMASPDSKTLTLKANILPSDPLQHTLKTDSALGLLGIEIGTRRRNRLNAHVTSLLDGLITLDVDQSFGNCPQYIQKRSVDFIRNPNDAPAASDVTSMHSLGDAARAMIQAADTFFVSSYINPADKPEFEGVDVSHRGGKPGFVKIEGDSLLVPDFPGNFYFNTLGNFLLNPKAGLLFLDFESGDVMQLTGTVELIDANDPMIKSFEGAERGWRFTLDHGQLSTNALPFRSVIEEYSPNMILLGDWQQAEASRQTKQQIDSWQPFVLERIVDESTEIRSFYLKPTFSAESTTKHQAGQFLTVRVMQSGNDAAQIRTYTVSSAPGDPSYRLSIKREAQGTVSRHLHDNASVGDIIEARPPAGDFYIDTNESRPAVLIAAGVGITPLVSMANHIANVEQQTQHRRSLTLIHAARTTAQRAFFDHFSAMANNSADRFQYHSVISQPEAHEKTGVDFSSTGRIDAALFKQLLALDDYDFYLCGPDEFMQSVYDALRTLGVQDTRIFAEAFGPSSLKRDVDVDTLTGTEDEADETVISFSDSGFEQRWNKGDATLLEVAEQHGLSPEFSCRNGSCGTCASKLINGSATYRKPVTAQHEDNEVLICCAVPAKNSTNIEIAL